MDRQRKDRLAKNEALFRSVNERVKALAAELPLEELVGGESTEAYLCECTDSGCMETIRLTHAEYERVRQSPVTFVVRPGHSLTTVERVVDETDRYWVIEKLAHEQEVVRASDPRS